MSFLSRLMECGMGRVAAAGSRAVPKRLAEAAPRFAANRRGATALEFAIVSMPFFGIIFLIFQVALYHFGLQSLDNATRLAARDIMTGSVPADAQTLAGFRDKLICPRLLMKFTCSSVIVNVYKVDPASDPAASSGIYQFVNVTASRLNAVPAQASFCLAGPGDFVFLDVALDFPNFVGSLLTAVGVAPPASFMMRSTTFFRNEPFTTAAMTC